MDIAHYIEWKITIGGTSQKYFDVDIAYRSIKGALDDQFAEVSISREKGDILHILTNGDRAYLMYMEYDGHPGKSAYDPNLPEDDRLLVFEHYGGLETPIYFFQTISTERALEIIRHYLINGMLPKDVDWEDWSKL